MGTHVEAHGPVEGASLDVLGGEADSPCFVSVTFDLAGQAAGSCPGRDTGGLFLGREPIEGGRSVLGTLLLVAGIETVPPRSLCGTGRLGCSGLGRPTLLLPPSPPRFEVHHRTELRSFQRDPLAHLGVELMPEGIEAACCRSGRSPATVLINGCKTVLAQGS
ncbi:hypothetical protein [Kineococcus sp. NUM-3379]